LGNGNNLVKKLAMDIIGKIFGRAGSEITKTIGDTIDNLSTSEEEKLQAKEKLTSTVMAQLVTMAQTQASIINTEAQGNWLQRSWRPILMLSFGFIIIYRYFVAPVFNLQAIELPVNFWDLLNIGIGGYVVGRSVEKVADTVVKNVDISFVKKKNRQLDGEKD
jgi:hypothetical protein